MQIGSIRNMQKIYHKISEKILKITNAFFGVFIFLVFYFALTSPNLTLGDNVNKQTIGDRTTWVVVLFLVTLILVTLITLVNRKIRVISRVLFIDYGLITGSILLTLSFILQLIVIFHTHPAIGFDPGAIHDALLDPNREDLKSYFSYNTNNLPLLLVQRAISGGLKNSSWLTFDLINSLLLLVTVLLNLLTVYLLDKKSLKVTLYIHALWIVVFPMVLVPYSDVAILPMVSALLALYALTSKTKNYFVILLSAIGIGIVVTCIYFIKPSAIIPIIAIFIIEIVMVTKKNIIKTLIIIFVIFGVVSTSYVYLQKQLSQQNYIKIQKNRTIPAIHFVSMGVSGDGGYNPSDALAMAKLKSQKEMREYSQKKLIARLHQKGVFGYLKFLIHKQNKNSADGTFGWLIEGHFMQTKPTGNGLKRLIQEFIYPGGQHLADFRFISQVWWIGLLGVIFLGWQQKNRYLNVLRLSITGGFIYLLIFEGGRSRYLIQFLPLFLILASLIYLPTIKLLTEKLAWIHASNN